jgi:uncharacterized repeat protein (TIGR01451 family)
MTMHQRTRHIAVALTTFVMLALALNAAGRPVPTRAQATGLIPVPPGSIPFNRTVAFDMRTPGSYDGILSDSGVHFAEGFAGKSFVPVTGSGGEIFEFPVGMATSPLTPQPGLTGKNLAIVDLDAGMGNALAGIGPLGFPTGNGHGAISVTFDTDQAAFGFDVRGGNGGPAQVNAFARDGTQLAAATIPGFDGPKVFQRAGGAADIAGILLFNADPGGLFFDNFGFSEPVGQQADVELVEKTVSTDPGLIGVPLSYTVTLRNNGPDPATGVGFRDFVSKEPTAPQAHVASASGSSPNGTCTTSPDIFFHIVRCPDLGTLDPGDTATVVVEVVPATAGTLINRNSEVFANETDPNPDNNANNRRPTISRVVNVDTYITAVVGPLVAGLVGDAPDDLNEGQAKALFASLRSARDAFLRGDYKQARHHIDSFRKKVDTVGSALPAEEQEALKQQADLMLQSMDFQRLALPF